MEYINEKQQIRNAIKVLEESIIHQEEREEKAYKRYMNKAFNSYFWILQDADTLHFILERERQLLKNLNDYLTQLRKKL